MSRSMHSSTEYFGSPERVAHVLERELLVDVGDREDIIEDALEPDVLAVLRRASVCSSVSKARVCMSSRLGMSMP